ncbi:helix-turn-helix domain-containing protein [Pseudalkalibacillus sp. Hm43]|uniref:helix-turn-helix domain-containing protein n=1 Tax=Pseudalkalibacillus sp. Hm43 TaxID=3450742 RepID=UPI003F42C952
MSIGQLIKNERLKRGYSTRELSTMIKASPSFISQVERGLIKYPNKGYLEKIADILEINLEKLLCDETHKEDLYTQSVLITDLTESFKYMDRKDIKKMHKVIFENRDLLFDIASLEKNEITTVRRFVKFLLEREK